MIFSSLNIRRIHIPLFLAGLLLSANSGAADLLEVYRLAEQNDPAYLRQTATYRATLEARSQAISGLLPAVGLRAETHRVEQDISSASRFSRSGEFDYNRHGYTLSLTQPVFRRDRLVALDQADSAISQAEAELAGAEQNLIMRIAARYFDVLASLDNLAFARAEVKSLSRQLQQANQRFEVGLSAITDVREAEAGHDLAVSRELQASNAVDNAREAVRELSGDDIMAFAGLGANMPLVKPDPETIESWTQLSLTQNFAVVAAGHAADRARKEIKRQAAGHYPTLDLVASKNYNSSGGQFGANKTHTASIGLRLDIPLYSGGRVSSQTRAAHENYNAAIYALERARRAAERLTREAYLGVISGISQVRALNQAVISSETALAATEAGFEVGTRTAVEVVASQRATSEAKRNYSRARYAYLLDTLRLKQAAGTLSPADLTIINTWLTKE